MSAPKSVLIAGGGVGGLSAAIAFLQRGVAVELIEKRPNFDVPGVGLGQPASALRIYRGFGILDEILETGFHYNDMAVFDPQYNLVAPHRFQMGDETLPAFCALPRQALHSILLERAKALGLVLSFNTEISTFGGEDGCEVTLSDGRQLRPDLVVGFDGIRSSARHYIVGTMFGPRPSGYGAWRIQVPRPDHVRGMEFLQGIGGKAGAIPITQDTMYLFNIRPEPIGAFFPSDQMHVLLKERLAQFGGYVAEIAEALTAESKIVYGALEPYLLPPAWNRGGVVVGGDAAHVVPPHLTAGAAMAVEDAVALAHFTCEGEGSREDRLARYASVRFARNAFVYSFARGWFETEQSVSNSAQLAQICAEMQSSLSARVAVADRFLEQSPY